MIQVGVIRMVEADLYPVIKQFLEEMDFTVKAEVEDVDVVAKRGDEFLLVEMKTKLSMKLLYQGCKRQKLFQNVYIAIPHPGSKTLRSKQFKEKVYLVKQLRLGLLLVKDSGVDVMLDPVEYQYRKDKRKQVKLVKEFHDRTSSINIGGKTKVKIMTAYREQAIEIAKCLNSGIQSTKDIRNMIGNPKVTRILYNNYYGWFQNTGRGLYELTDLGKEELVQFLEKLK